MRRIKIAKASYVNALQGIERAFNDRFFIMPCNLDWNNANNRRFPVSRKNGKCLRFVAASYGDIFVVFATNPNNEWTWYYFQISSYGVALFKVKNKMSKLNRFQKLILIQAGLVVKYKLDYNAGSLKDAELFRGFFICMNYEDRVLLNNNDIYDSNFKTILRLNQTSKFNIENFFKSKITFN